MPKDTNPLTDHNSHFIDKAAREFVELATRAITKKSHGSLTVTFEWRAGGAHRFVTNEELSNFCLPRQAAE